MASKQRGWLFYLSLIVGMSAGLIGPSNAFAFIDPPVLVPANPVAGEMISVSIRYGECDGISAAPPTITQTGNSIHMLLETTHFDDPLFCQNPISTGVFDVGTFPGGEYTLHVERFYETLVPEPVFETLANFTFTVSGAPSPNALPSFGLVAGLLLIGGLVGLVARRQRALLGLGSFCAALILAPISQDLRAQDTSYLVEALLSGQPGTPTPEDVVFWVDGAAGGDPPLAAFRDVGPQGAAFLLARRAHPELKTWLDQHPDSARAKLERYLLIRYPGDIDVELALHSLRTDPAIEAAYVSPAVDFSSTELSSFAVYGDIPLGPLGNDYEWSTLNLEAAWFRATGYALVGITDTGLYINHSALRQFSASGQYIGGNFIPAASLDVGGTSTTDYNVDEQEPESITDPSCNPSGLPGVPVTFAGHGTHVSGLVGSNVSSGLGFKGTCKHCGVAMARIAAGFCDGNGVVITNITFPSVAEGITWLADSGVQIVNMSLGAATLDPPDYCATHPSKVWCLAMTYADSRGVVLVGASGNWLIRLQFPAADPRVVAVGGYDDTITFWDESPGNYANCPYGDNRECGSNWSRPPSLPKQEVVSGAKSIVSSMYPGKDWNTVIGCGDSFATTPSDGVGSCTGTSMSAPLISGVMGILRSVNPLVPPSVPVPPVGQPWGMRTVLINTTFQAQSSIPWDPKLGYGRPDANSAIQNVLGWVAGSVIKNRVTPLFRLYGSTSKDYLDTTSPQFAHSALFAAGGYTSQGATVPGYPTFPSASTPPSVPKASVYVLTTEYKPRASWPDLIPLHMVDRGHYFPMGCQGVAGCVLSNQDFTLLTTTTHIEQARVSGYNLRTIQGYIYQPCTPEPSCIPPGAEKFYRACKSVDGDCATFLENERTTFEGMGYTTAFPAGSNKRLGYAYPAVDSDGDGLVDGFEYVVGTNILLKDSDGDGSCSGSPSVRCDANEFPMVGLPISDPCDGPSGGNCPASDIIFQDGFD